MSKQKNIKASISAVIPALNEAKNISKCLSGILEQTQLPKEVIVVDHNSTDQTPKILKEFAPKFKEKNITFKVLKETKPGIAVARNTGWYQATQPIIASLDADCIPASDWIQTIENFFQSHKQSLAITGKVVHHDANPVWRYITDKGNYYKHIGQLARLKIGFVPITTANAAVRKSAFKKVHGFNEKIVSINGLDDVELASRIAKLGAITYVSEMVVFSSVRRYTNLEKALYSLIKRGKALNTISKNFKKSQLKS